jgi:hypothetical protein
MTDFGGYRQIIEEARQLEQEQRAKPLVDCPICGAVLVYSEKRGLVSCPMGHYRVAGRPPS